MPARSGGRGRLLLPIAWVGRQAAVQVNFPPIKKEPFIGVSTRFLFLSVGLGVMFGMAFSPPVPPTSGRPARGLVGTVRLGWRKWWRGRVRFGRLRGSYGTGSCTAMSRRLCTWNEPLPPWLRVNEALSLFLLASISFLLNRIVAMNLCLRSRKNKDYQRLINMTH